MEKMFNERSCLHAKLQKAKPIRHSFHRDSHSVACIGFLALLLIFHYHSSFAFATGSRCSIAHYKCRTVTILCKPSCLRGPSLRDRCLWHTAMASALEEASYRYRMFFADLQIRKFVPRCKQASRDVWINHLYCLLLKKYALQPRTSQ